MGGMATKTVIRLGFPERSIKELAAAVSAAIGVEAEGRDSDYMGVYYNYGVRGLMQCELIENLDPLWRQGDAPDEEFWEPQHQDKPCLLDIGGEANHVEPILARLAAAFTQAILISRQEV
jgi:hypothetical protein